MQPSCWCSMPAWLQGWVGRDALVERLHEDRPVTGTVVQCVEPVFDCEQPRGGCLCPGCVCKISTGAGTLLLFWYSPCLQTISHVQFLLADSAVSQGWQSCTWGHHELAGLPSVYQEAHGGLLATGHLHRATLHCMCTVASQGGHPCCQAKLDCSIVLLRSPLCFGMLQQVCLLLSAVQGLYCRCFGILQSVVLPPSAEQRGSSFAVHGQGTPCSCMSTDAAS